MMLNPYLDFSHEVAVALQHRQPVVALESTIISHGMPYPQNVETAWKVEATVQRYGAIPATIAVMDGRLKVGLTGQEIKRLGREGTQVQKTSRRDLPVVLATGRTGSTTVASTMLVAAMAGISVFATGGIGGVHRGAGLTMDISADLQELAQTRVTVVCAGAKSILDIGLTLEYLETHGVPVIGYQTSEFPAFYSRKSGFPVDHEAGSVEELARILHIKQALGLKGGAVVANPVPEKEQADHYIIDKAIRQALQESETLGIKGKDITPFLLAKVEQLTKGDSLKANIQLVLNNARLAALLAKAMLEKTAG